MFHVGCASACSGVTSLSSSRDRPRNGLALPVNTRSAPSRVRFVETLMQREALESTGSIRLRSLSRTGGERQLAAARALLV